VVFTLCCLAAEPLVAKQRLKPNVFTVIQGRIHGGGGAIAPLKPTIVLSQCCISPNLASRKGLDGSRNGDL